MRPRELGGIATFLPFMPACQAREDLVQKVCVGLCGLFPEHVLPDVGAMFAFFHARLPGARGLGY